MKAKSSSSILSFLKSSAVYALTIAFTKLGQIIFLPIFAKVLGQEDFGKIAFVLSISPILQGGLDLGYSSAFQRYFPGWSDVEKQFAQNYLVKKYCFIGLLISIGTGVFGLFIWPSLFEQVSFYPLVPIFLVGLFFNQFFLVKLAIWRLQDNLKSFFITSILHFVTQISLIYVLISIYNMGTLGYIIGWSLSPVVLGVFSFLSLLSFKNREDISQIKTQMTLFSKPLVPSIFLENLNDFIDKLFLEKYLPMASLGIYYLGSKLGSIIRMINQAMKSSFLPYVYRAIYKDNFKENYSKNAVFYIYIIAIPALFILLYWDTLVLLCGLNAFYDAKDIVPYFVMGGVFIGATTAFGRGMDISADNKKMWFIPALSLTANVLGLSLLVPRLGILGAGISYLLSNFVRLSVCTFISMRLFPVQVSILKVLCPFLAVGVAWGVWFSMLDLSPLCGQVVLIRTATFILLSLFLFFVVKKDHQS